MDRYELTANRAFFVTEDVQSSRRSSSLEASKVLRQQEDWQLNYKIQVPVIYQLLTRNHAQESSTQINQ